MPSRELEDAVVKAYARVARPLILRWFPEPNSCIAASRATIEVLALFGIHAWPLSVRMQATVPERKMGFGLGLLPEERKRAERIPGHQKFSTRTKGWDGHVIVGTEHHWLIDPTFDTTFAAFRRLGYDPPVKDYILAVNGEKEVDPLAFIVEASFGLDDGNTLQLKYLASPNEDYRNAPAWETDHLQVLIQQIWRAIIEFTLATPGQAAEQTLRPG